MAGSNPADGEDVRAAKRHSNTYRLRATIDLQKIRNWIKLGAMNNPSCFRMASTAGSPAPAPLDARERPQ